MEKNCLILLDTNICIYRTLAYLEPRILEREELDKVTDKIDTLSNNNFSCKIIITDTVAKELSSNGILAIEISDFCVKKLHYPPYSRKFLSIFEGAKKSMGKFVLKYNISQELRSCLDNLSCEIKGIDDFYLKYPERIKDLTDKKTRHLKSFDKKKKLSQRPNNLPEENDRLLLAEAKRINESNGNSVYIFSNDGDFTDFKTEINEEFKIGILGIEDEVSKGN